MEDAWVLCSLTTLPHWIFSPIHCQHPFLISRADLNLLKFYAVITPLFLDALIGIIFSFVLLTVVSLISSLHVRNFPRYTEAAESRACLSIPLYYLPQGIKKMGTGFYISHPRLLSLNQDSLSDNFWDVDLIHGDELGQLSKAVQKTDLSCELGTEKRGFQPSVFYTKKRAPGDPYKVQHNK